MKERVKIIILGIIVMIVSIAMGAIEIESELSMAILKILQILLFIKGGGICIAAIDIEDE